MSKIGEYEPNLLCMGLLRTPLELARKALVLQLESAIKKEAIRSALQQIDWRLFFERDGQFYEIKRFQIALLSAREDLTVYVCNLADGWLSLFGNIVRARNLDAYFFRATLLEKAEFKVFEMMRWRNGDLKRHVSALQDDDGWKFVNRGDALPFESSMQYKRRQVSGRLNRRLIEMYSEAAGFGIGSVTQFGGDCWRFWRDQ